MRSEKPIFCQVMDWIRGEQFRRCVNRDQGNSRIRNFSCWDQFLAMSFAQITYRDSLADIEVCLRSRQDQLYRLGFRSTIAHSTLADANTHAAQVAALQADLTAAVRKAHELELNVVRAEALLEAKGIQAATAETRKPKHIKEA